MKNILFIIIFTAYSLQSNAQISKNDLRVYLDCKQFFSPSEKNYAEIYLQFVATSINYIPLDNGLIAELAIQMSISKADSMIYQDAYRLKSPFMKDSIIEDFYDIKRFALEAGSYNLNIQVLDLNGADKPLNANVPIVIEELKDGISISDIETAELIYKCDDESQFHKSGVCVIPRLATFYPTEAMSIPTYIEFYNTNTLEDSVFAIKQMISDEKGLEISEFTTYSRHKTAEVVPVLRNIDIKNLKTGKYILSFTLLNKQLNELAVQSYEFDRSNDDLEVYDPVNIVLDPNFQASISDDSVSYYLESLIPISGAAEMKNIIKTIKTKDIEKQRKHIQAFWAVTAPVNTYDNWILYKAQVQLVERKFSNNFQEGFETDRGRVYLQYGSPTTMVSKETSPTEYPYEIWQYNKIGKYSNKRFVFYNPDLVNNTYRLLHSDMIGELKNPGWPQTLMKRNTSSGNVDNQNLFLQDQYGDNANDLYRQY